MSLPWIAQLYEKLPAPAEHDDDELWAAGHLPDLEQFRLQVADRYLPGTLTKLLDHADPVCRRAAVLGLGMIGDMHVNSIVAARLQDEDETVRRLASEALWSIWFRGACEHETDQLEKALRHRSPQKVMRDLDALVSKSSGFAEAYNQRAILHFRLGEFRKAIADCERTLRLNPHHFGAAAGMAQCYMKLNKPRAALRSFRNALKINPNLDDVKDAIRTLEDVLGEE